MIARTILIPAVLFVLACAAGEDAGTLEIDRGRLAAALTIPSGLLQEVTDLGQDLRPDRLSTFPFSMLVMSARFEDSADLRRLPVEGAPPLTPRELWEDAGKGRLTLIPVECILAMNSQVDGATASGEFRFLREGVIEGRGTFLAEQIAGGWQVVELGLPATGESTRRRDDGTWEYVPAE